MLKVYRPAKQIATFLSCLLFIGMLNVQDLTAEAKKKAEKVDPAAQAAAEAEAKAKAAEAEIQKALTPLEKKLTQLMMRIQGRGLFSPEEAGQLVEIKYQLLDLMEKYPQNSLLAKPIYQAGTLFVEREAYNDAFEMFNYLAQSSNAQTYSPKAKVQIQQLEKRFGSSYFSVELATPVVATSSSNGNAPTASSATTPPPATEAAVPPKK